MVHKSEYVTNRLVEVLKPVKNSFDIAPGGITKPPGDRLSVREYCTEGRLVARCAPPGGDEKTVRSGGRWRLAVGECRQAVWSSFRLAACGLGQAETLLFCVLWCAVFN